MNLLLLFGILILNAVISAWNAYSSGAYLTESKIIGGWTRFIVWCGLVMSACGFTWCYLTVFGLIGITTGKLTPEQLEALFNLGYLMILLPLLGSGLGIWIHSLVEAYRRRTFGSVAVAGWNTFAQAHNTWSAAKNAPNAIDGLFKFFGGKKGSRKNDGGAVVILLAILALSAGIITTALIARWADKKVAIDVTGGRQTA